MPEAFFYYYYYSYFKNHVLDFLIPGDCSVSDSLLQLYCRSLPGLWHYQQKMQLLKEWIIVLEGPLEGGEDTKTGSERQNLALQRNGSKKHSGSLKLLMMVE